MTRRFRGLPKPPANRQWSVAWIKANRTITTLTWTVACVLFADRPFLQRLNFESQGYP